MKKIKKSNDYVISKSFDSGWKPFRIRLKFSLGVSLVTEPAVVDDDVLVAGVQVALLHHLLGLNLEQVLAGS